MSTVERGIASIYQSNWTHTYEYCKRSVELIRPLVRCPFVCFSSGWINLASCMLLSRQTTNDLCSSLQLLCSSVKIQFRWDFFFQMARLTNHRWRKVSTIWTVCVKLQRRFSVELNTDQSLTQKCDSLLHLCERCLLQAQAKYVHTTLSWLVLHACRKNIVVLAQKDVCSYNCHVCHVPQIPLSSLLTYVYQQLFIKTIHILH